VRTLPSFLALVALAAPLAAVDFTGLPAVGDVTAVTRTETRRQPRLRRRRHRAGRVLAPDLVRVRTLFAGQPAAPDHSWAVARTDWAAAPWQLSESPEAVTLTTGELAVVVQRAPLLVEFRDAATHRVINADARPSCAIRGPAGSARRSGSDSTSISRPGEKAARLDRRRGEFILWNSDTPGYVEGTGSDLPEHSLLSRRGGRPRLRPFLRQFLPERLRLRAYHARNTPGTRPIGGVLDYYFFQGRR